MSKALPPETLSNVLERIDLNREGRQTLIACALVATWWVGPCQRRLFSAVSIDEENHQRWMDGVVLPSPKTRLLQHIRSLLLGSDGGTECPTQSFAGNFGSFLSALRNLRSLTLRDISIVSIGEEAFHTCFSAFRESLTELSLERFNTSFNVFATLVGYFPNVTTLRLEILALDVDEGPATPSSLPLRGEIYIRYTPIDWQEFANRFTKLNPEYDRMVIDARPFMEELGPFMVETAPLESILQLSASSVKYLRLESIALRGYPCCTPLSLHSLTCTPHSSPRGFDKHQQFSATPRIRTVGGLAWQRSQPPPLDILH